LEKRLGWNIWSQHLCTGCSSHLDCSPRLSKKYTSSFRVATLSEKSSTTSHLKETLSSSSYTPLPS
jgi:hypothetical protein